MYCSDSLEYSIRGDVVVVAVATDVIVLEWCKVCCSLLCKCFVINFVVVFVMYLVSIFVVSSCKEPCNILCRLCLLLLKDV